MAYRTCLYIHIWQHNQLLYFLWFTRHIYARFVIVLSFLFSSKLGKKCTGTSSSRQECTRTWVLILRAWPNCTGKNQSYIQLKTDCYLHLRLHWESDRPKSFSELVDGRDQSKFLRYVTPGEYGTRKEGVFISVNSGVDYSIYSSSSSSSIGWYK
jgi:hypothetical protein